MGIRLLTNVVLLLVSVVSVSDDVLLLTLATIEEDGGVRLGCVRRPWRNLALFTLLILG